MKTLCDLDKKEIEKNLSLMMKMVDRPAYICMKVRPGANTKALLCKPVKIQPTSAR
ncbi:MAG: hypothetical protein R2861_06605 [Desulfobacterales bacterium]